MKPRVKTIQERFAKASKFGRITMAEREEFECEGCKRWKTRALFMCILVGFVGFVLGLEGCYGVLRREREEGERVEWERKAQVMVENFNLSKTQLQSLVLFLSSSPEREIFEKEESEKNHDNVLHKVPSSVNGFEVEGNKSVVPSVTQNVETRMKECETILNCEKLAKSTEEFLNQVTENKLNIFILLSVLLATILSFKLLTHIKNLNPTNQIQHKKQSFQPPISKSGGKRKKLLFLGVFLGISVSVWLFFSMNENIIARQMETLVNMCDERARMLQDQFNVSMNHVQALAILVSTFHHEKNPSAIDQKTFKEYTARTAFERPLTSGVAYALKVTHSERELFEIERGWKIKKMERGGDQREEYSPEKLDPSPEKEEYAPVIFSQDTVSHIVSVDMMSGKDDRDNIIRSRSTGKGALTAPFNLLKYNHLGVVLTFAVYKYELPPNATPQERIDATIGYLGASFDVPSLVEKLLQQLASKQKIIVNVYDTTNSSSPIKMYGPDLTGFDDGDDYVSHVDFGDPTRKHEMRCRFKDKAAFPWSAMMASGGVAVIVLLVGHIFYQALNRIEKVEDDYREMSELKGRAEAADVAKSQFLATVSHEIRTPMNGVLGMLQMLTDTDLDATQQDFVMTAQESGKALIMLINEVLDQARIESGRLELETVPFDVRDILDNVLSLFSDKSQAKGIELAVYVSSQVPEVLVGDPGRFRQIITNLVGNSMKFTEQGHIFVSVHLLGEIKKSSDPTNQPSLKTPESEFTTNNTLSGRPIIDRQEIIHKFRTHESPKNPNKPVNLFVTVEDTGVGIPEEAQDRIFTPFMQADSSTSRNYGGTGIGLSISKCLVELMGGEIGFVSKPLIGSTFSFNAVFEKSGVEIVGDVKRYCGEIVSSDFQGMRALVVDGSEIRAEITRYHLQRLGVHADVATDKESALSALLEACSLSGRGSLDMVLVDKEAWGPDSTGLSFPLPLINLQKNGTLMEHWQRIPKLFLLATSLNSSEIEELKSNGYVDSIMKPLRLSMLAACLRKVLGIANKRQVQAKSDSLALKELLKGKNILVVDDNAINRKVAEGALRKYGAVVTCVDSGKDAIRILSPPHEIDACFMDVQMPEMDGFEATRLIRSAEKEFNMPTGKGEMQNYWHVPILAMTADVIQATYEECLRCGMDGYVSKPFEEQQLYTAVAQFLESNSVLDS